MSTPSSNDAQIKEISQGSYFLDRDMTKIRREINIQNRINMLLFFEKRHPVPTDISFQHNQGEKGDETICTYTEDGEKKIKSYSFPESALPLQKIANDDEVLQAIIEPIKLENPDFMKVLAILPYLTRLQLAYFRDLFTDEEAKVIMEFVIASNSYNHSESEEHKKQYAQSLHTMLLKADVLPVLQRAVQKYNEPEIKANLQRILIETPTLVETPAQRIDSSAAVKPPTPPMRPLITPSFQQTKNTFFTEKQKFMEKINEVLGNINKNIKTLEEELAEEKNKNIFNRSKLQVKMITNQIQEAKLRQKELSGFLTEIDAINQKPVPQAEQKEILEKSIEKFNSQFKEKNLGLQGLINNLIKENGAYIANYPKDLIDKMKAAISLEKITTESTSVLIKVNPEDKVRNALKLEMKLQNLIRQLITLDSAKPEDISKLELISQQYAEILQAYLVRNNTASGLKGFIGYNSGKVYDMLTKAEGELKKLNVKPLVATEHPEPPTADTHKKEDLLRKT